MSLSINSRQFTQKSIKLKGNLRVYRESYLIKVSILKHGKFKHFLPLVNGDKKLNLELSFETQSHM